jgi:hypothetical protein
MRGDGLNMPLNSKMHGSISKRQKQYWRGAEKIVRYNVEIVY